jgi:hypothetical protein
MPCALWGSQIGSGIVTCGSVRRARPDDIDDQAMSVHLIYQLLRQILQMLTQLARDDGAKERKNISRMKGEQALIDEIRYSSGSEID